MIRGILVVCSILVPLIFNSAAYATSNDIVISRIQTGGAGTGNAGQEFIALSNSTAVDIDISGWCVGYADYTYSAVADVYCFEPNPTADEVHMPGRGTVILASHTYPTPPSNVTALFKSASLSLSSTRGHVVLFDAADNIIDLVAWDNKASLPPTRPETLAASAPTAGSMLVRNSSNGAYIDTDNNFADFSTASSVLPSVTSLIDYKRPVEVIDLCGNLDGLQETMPAGYDFDEAGNCERVEYDLCQNINRIQLALPISYMSDMQGNCYNSALDACKNLEGFQVDIPSGYRVVTSDVCKLRNQVADVFITELMPNVSGTDTGKEYIELYNNSTSPIDLSDYRFLIGKQLEKTIYLPEVDVAPNSYIYFLDTDHDFTLLNTTTRVQLVFYDNTLVREVVPYDSPSDDKSWSLIDGVWQYTNNPTPGLPNQPATDEVLGTNTENGLTPCPEGKYRSPLTTRCRNIENDAATLVACDADEYRSPDTNRCRKLAALTSSLTPCEEGSERNVETNRCRKIAQDAVLAACAEGYERNPATNRCRKVLDVAGSENQAQSANTNTMPNMYPLFATAALGGAAYGAYEWKMELANMIRRMLSRILPK